MLWNVRILLLNDADRRVEWRTVFIDYFEFEQNQKFGEGIAIIKETDLPIVLHHHVEVSESSGKFHNAALRQ